MTGLINLDKPPALSSARAVARVKRLLPKGTKIGHAGTLDPFATGVLVLLVGKATKLCEQIMGQEKEYLATVKLGSTTDTLDPESPEIPGPAIAPPSREQIESILPRFTGLIQQMPPVYSALKIGGRPAYKLARQGEEVILQPRPVHIYQLELLAYTWPQFTLRIACGRGTYIRSLARDLAETLGTTGHLTALRRTRIGPFRADNAVTLDTLSQGGVEPHLISPAL